jgi:hypothetical protein
MPTDFSSFNPFATTIVDPGSGQTLWVAPNGSHAWQNTDTVIHAGIAPGQLSLHPGSGFEASVLRFTAQSDGIANVDAVFLPGDVGIMDVGVRDASGFLGTAEDSGSFGLASYAMSAGDTLDFVVYGGYASGNTALDVFINFEASESSVSAPGTLSIILAGMTLLSLQRRKRPNTRASA